MDPARHLRRAWAACHLPAHASISAAARPFGLRRDRGLDGAGVGAPDLVGARQVLEDCNAEMVFSAGPPGHRRAVPATREGRPAFVGHRTAFLPRAQGLGPASIPPCAKNRSQTPVIGIVPGKIITERTRSRPCHRQWPGKADRSGARHPQDRGDRTPPAGTETSATGFVQGFRPQARAPSTRPPSAIDSHNICVGWSHRGRHGGGRQTGSAKSAAASSWPRTARSSLKSPCPWRA